MPDSQQTPFTPEDRRTSLASGRLEARVFGRLTVKGAKPKSRGHFVRRRATGALFHKDSDSLSFEGSDKPGFGSISGQGVRGGGAGKQSHGHRPHMSGQQQEPVSRGSFGQKADTFFLKKTRRPRRGSHIDAIQVISGSQRVPPVNTTNVPSTRLELWPCLRESSGHLHKTVWAGGKVVFRGPEFISGFFFFGPQAS